MPRGWNDFSFTLPGLMGWTRALEKLLDATPKTHFTLVILLWDLEFTFDINLQPYAQPLITIFVSPYLK